MRRIPLDTSACSALLRGQPDAPRIVRETGLICVNPVVLGELRSGFLIGAQKSRNESELAKFLNSARVRVLNITEETASRYAGILHCLRKAGTPIPVNDLWIAATAMEFGLRLLTSDAHFLRVPQVQVEMLPAGGSVSG